MSDAITPANSGVNVKSPLFTQMNKPQDVATGNEKAIIKDVMEILAGTNLNVTRSNDTTATGNAERKTTGGSNVPSLDNPSDVKQLQENLEKLIAYLKLDNDERQSEMAKDRIETNKASFKSEHDGRTKKLQETIEKMDKAEKARKASRIFGWLMAAIAVVVAVAACIATGGIAVGPVVGALVAVGLQIANETGAMEELNKAVTDFLVDKCGMKKEAAQIVAAIAITVAIIAVSAGSGFAASKVAATTGLQQALSHTINASVQAIAETATKVTSLVSKVAQLGSIGAGTAAAVTGYQAGISSSELKETEKFIAAIKQRLEESEEELQAILQAIQNNIANIAQLLDSATDTSEEIAQHMGQMA